MSTQITQTQTFHLFAHLPTENQILIWEHAAEVEDKTWLREDATYEAVSFCNDNWSRGSPPFFKAILKNSALYGYHTRNALLGTCRLAKMFAWKAWRAVIQDIEGQDITWYLLDLEDGYREYLMTDLKVKEDILRSVDGLIAEARERM